MKQLTSKDYTLIQSGYQLTLPLNLESIIPSDDKVRLLSQFVEELGLTELYSTYSYSRVRKSSATLRQMIRVVLRAFMNRLYSPKNIGLSARHQLHVPS